MLPLASQIIQRRVCDLIFELLYFLRSSSRIVIVYTVMISSRTLLSTSKSFGHALEHIIDLSDLSIVL